MRRISCNSESGVILPMVIILMLALTITGLAFLNAAVMEHNLVSRGVYKNQAFYLTEAGLERTLWNLKRDFENGSTDWTEKDPDGWVRINGVPVDEGNGNILLYDGSSEGSVDLGEGSYLVKLQYVDDGAGGYKEDELWVRSTGTVKDIPKTVQMYVRIENVFPWNNAIFAGTGITGGAVIEGNTRVHGSVLTLGENLTSSDLALDMSGGGGIRNNYEGMPVELADKIHLCPQTTFNGEWVDSLEAKLRVKRGKVGLSGTDTVGEPDLVGNFFKETMDGVYVSHGYGGNQGANNVYSDNGTGNGYDLGDKIQFPRLTGPCPYINPFTGSLYGTYLDYLNVNSLHITETAISGQTDDFDYPFDGKGSIKWTKQQRKLEVEGIVYVDADFLDIGDKHETIEYSGKGSLVVARSSSDEIVGDIRIHGDLVAEGTYAADKGFPTNVLGFMTGRIELATGPGESGLTMMGAFYAENEIVSAKQNEISGTFVSNHFDMGKNVPRIYQVPELADNLPPGMIASEPIWHITTSQWSEQ